MTAQFPLPLTLRLARGEVLAWHRGRARLQVVSGRVWITRRDDLADHFLHCGQGFELRAEQGTVISAEQDVCLRFECEPGWAERFRAACRAQWGRLTGRASTAATVGG